MASSKRSEAFLAVWDTAQVVGFFASFTTCFASYFNPAIISQPCFFLSFFSFFFFYLSLEFILLSMGYTRRPESWLALFSRFKSDWEIIYFLAAQSSLAASILEM